MGARARAAILRREGPLSRLPNRVRAGRPRPARGRGSGDRPLPRRARLKSRQSGLHLRAWRRKVRWWEPVRSRLRGGPGMTIGELADSIYPWRIEAVQRFGFTERQARFLVHVLVHSGVFLERQYRAFTGLAHGQKTHDFLAKLVGGGYATPVTPGALHRGRFYHVQYKPLYEAIGEANNRHRKPASLGRFVERLMLLDAVLADPGDGRVVMEQDKRAYFREAFEKAMPDDWYRHVQIGS